MTNPDSQSLSFLSTGVLRRLSRIIVPASLVLFALVSLLYFQEVSKERALLESDAAHTADLQRDITLRELGTVESDVLFLAEQSVLREFVSTGAKRREVEAEYLLFCGRRGTYDQIRYLDHAGMEVIRINYGDGRPAAVPESELQSKADRYYFREAIILDRGQVFVSPFDLNVEHGEIEQPRKPVIRFATPVFDEAGAVRGLLVLNYLGARLLAKLDEVATRSSGTFLLVNQDGYFLRGRSLDEEWAFMFGVPRTFPQAYPEEWRVIAAGNGGRISTRNGIFAYRTVALSRHVSGGDDPGAGASREAAALGTADQRIKILAHVPGEVIVAVSARVLRLLLAVSGPALVLLFLLSWYLAYAGALREGHKQRIADSEARLRALATRLLTAQEDERRRIARDLHDDVGQVATALSLDLQRAIKTDGDKHAEALGRAVRDADCLLERVHAISARVRPSLLDDLGLKDTVRSYLAEFEERTGIAVHADLRMDAVDVPPAVSENTFRILQEALLNVAKHALVKRVDVLVHASPEHVTVSVSDRGVGFVPHAVNGDRLGLLGMRERAELLGGEFVLHSQPGAGTELRVTLPIAARTS